MSKLNKSEVKFINSSLIPALDEVDIVVNPVSTDVKQDLDMTTDLEGAKLLKVLQALTKEDFDDDVLLSLEKFGDDKVPLLTLDFGDGRSVEMTFLTENEIVELELLEEDEEEEEGDEPDFDASPDPDTFAEFKQKEELVDLKTMRAALKQRGIVCGAKPTRGTKDTFALAVPETCNTTGKFQALIAGVAEDLDIDEEEEFEDDFIAQYAQYAFAATVAAKVVTATMTVLEVAEPDDEEEEEEEEEVVKPKSTKANASATSRSRAKPEPDDDDDDDVVDVSPKSSKVQPKAKTKTMTREDALELIAKLTAYIKG